MSPFLEISIPYSAATRKPRLADGRCAQCGGVSCFEIYIWTKYYKILINVF